jgi:hypothetical protein
MKTIFDLLDGSDLEDDDIYTTETLNVGGEWIKEQIRKGDVEKAIEISEDDEYIYVLLWDNSTSYRSIRSTTIGRRKK